jgi:hypothetical protein
MNWNQIVERQSQEYAEHINSVKTTKELLHADKKAVIAAAKTTEADLPGDLKDMLSRNAEKWEKEYGMYGSRFKEMRLSHQRELNKFFERELLTADLNKDLSKSQDKGKDKSAGR